MNHLSIISKSMLLFEVFVLLMCFPLCFTGNDPERYLFFTLTIHLLINIHIVDAILYHYIPFVLCQQLLNRHTRLRSWLPYSLLTQSIGGYLVQIVSSTNGLLYQFNIFLKTQFNLFLNTQINYFYESYIYSLLSTGSYLVEVVSCAFSFLLYQFIPFLFTQFHSLFTSFMNFHFFVVEIVSSTFNFILFYSMQLGIDRLVLILIVIYLLKKDNRATFTPVRRVMQLTLQEEFLCVVCFTNRKCVLIRPCNHVCLCNECTNQLLEEEELKECPLCRGLVIRVERVFI